jgi:replication initiator protein
VRTRSPIIELGRSKRQLLALSACRLLIHHTGPGWDHTLDTKPITEIFVARTPDDRLPLLMPMVALPRVAFLNLQAEAVRSRSPVIELGRSKSAAYRKLGLNTSGAAHWKNIERQLLALSACRLLIHHTSPGGDHTLDTKPITEIFVARTPDDRQPLLMPLTVALSADFYADLIRRAVPMDKDAVAYLVHRQAPLALDIYAWLAHRLYRIQEGTRVQIPWAMLREQFADPTASGNAAKDFKTSFLNALAMARHVYPDARVERWTCGLALLPSRPPVSRVLVAVSGGKR